MGTGNLSSDSKTGQFTPEMVFCTSSGRVGIILNVDDQNLALELSSLQRNLGNLNPKAIGGESHSK